MDSLRTACIKCRTFTRPFSYISTQINAMLHLLRPISQSSLMILSLFSNPHHFCLIEVNLQAMFLKHLLPLLQCALLLFPGALQRSQDRLRKGSRGITAHRGMSAHPIIDGSTQYLALRPCHTVASNPHVGLLISQFARIRVSKKVCLKTCF